MNYKGFLLLIISLFLVAGTAEAGREKPLLLAQIGTLTAEDLGVENPGLLPTNPFYFFKEWRRALIRTVTFDPVAKADLELKIANEKAAEVKKVEESDGTNPLAIVKALRNYSEAQVRLKDRLSALKENSENPNIDRLLQNLTDRAIKHERLFDSLAQKFSENKEIVNLTDSAKGTLEQSMAVAGEKDGPEKFSARLEKSLLENTAGELKNSHATVIIERIRERSSEEIKKALENIYLEFSDKAREDVSGLLKEKNVQELEGLLQAFPDSSQRQDIGVQIFNKQKEELTAPKPSLMSLPVPPEAIFSAEIVVCDQVKKNLDDIWNLFKGGKITEQEYKQKYEVLKGQYAGCEAVSERQATTTAVEAGGSTICTMQYSPVCGTDNRTYSNECVIKASNMTIQYGGECKPVILPGESSVSATATIQSLFGF